MGNILVIDLKTYFKEISAQECTKCCQICYNVHSNYTTGHPPTRHSATITAEASISSPGGTGDNTASSGRTTLGGRADKIIRAAVNSREISPANSLFTAACPYFRIYRSAASTAGLIIERQSWRRDCNDHGRRSSMTKTTHRVVTSRLTELTQRDVDTVCRQVGQCIKIQNVLNQTALNRSLIVK